MNTIYAALEIGTTRTVLAIGEADKDNQLKMLCHSEIPSTGIRKSQILDINQATQSIRAVLQQIEQKRDASGAKITIGNAYLAVSGQHIKADPFVGSIQVEGARVGDHEINEVLHAAQSMTLPKDRELLEIVEQDYVLDRLGGITNPKGMSGRVLRLNALHIHADHDRLQDARTAAEASHLEICEPLFAATCAADAVLTEQEKRSGVLVLDLGGGSTGYAVYSDNYTISAGVIGVGGDHVMNDIAHAFQTTNAQAERLKIHESSALISTTSSLPPRVRIETGDNMLMDNRTVSRIALNTVVNARMSELFSLIRETLEEQDLLHRLSAGIVLTGGGAQLRDVCTLAEQVLGMPARIGKPINILGLEDEPAATTYATVAGCLISAHRNSDESSVLGGILGRFFK